MRALTAILLAGALSAGLSPRAFAQASPADSTLDAFMRALSDSTDDYFGLAAQRPDTAGLDSALAWGLANPGREGGRRRGRLTLAPAYGFNRVDGHRPGIGAALGRESGTGRVSGTLQYALESEQLMGGAQFVKRWRASDRLHAWVATLGGGRSSEAFDRDFFDPVFSTLNGALYGADRHDYVQRDGVRLSLVREAPRWNASVQLRDQLESPQPARTTWNLFGNELSAPANAPAAFGRVRELELAAHTELPFVPFSAEVQHATSGDALGSDLTYHR